MIALSSQSVLRRKLDTIANNIANMNTTGFKSEKMMFVEHLERNQSDNGFRGERKLSFVRDVATYNDFSEGAFQKTGNALDLALHGDGYFTIRTAAGERYTRNGSFTIDNGGQLVTNQGDPVLAEGGQPIFFSPQDAHITIATDGSVSTENGPLGKLALASFANPRMLKREPGQMFSATQPPTPATQARVEQGMLEQSNVQPIVEMTRMIQVQRAYESVNKMISREDDRIRKMIQDMANQQVA
ncbi:flagellar basal-body rod protein FlgF [Varunaivibrio sulfuroxidans]|nr:flagellar basal-body rod protein FlgF [Varunaivibrio sulfuroxidans]WES31907.1 flagellar basal-body rod protein FlgF [Varunaivibrio sulfuroxidans]